MLKTGLVIGKFYPPHRGHKLVIDAAMAQARQVTVLVCDGAGQTIPAALRAAWLREIHPSVNVRVVPDELDPDDSQAWADATKRWLSFVPDAVFTSEAYGDSYAHFLGSHHVLVDQFRLAAPVSGTAVRQNPLAHWDFLEPCVRAFFAVRVCVLRAESTGTTTLAQALAGLYKTTWVREYGRDYWEEKQKRGESEWRTDEFVHIARRQSTEEDEAARQANRVLVCDTDAFATAVWHERYLEFRSPDVEKISQTRRRADLYLLTNVDIPFVQDGARDGEHLRLWMHKRFLEELTARKLPFAVISGNREKRLWDAVARIAPLLD